MTVTARDFVEMEPYETCGATLSISQRIHVAVQPHDSSQQSAAAGAFQPGANLTSCPLARQPLAKPLTQTLYPRAPKLRRGC
ncbi:hypothetical protein DL766_009980 [Monosporascus sp. MC13-8B]|uniref:Uncharacterized protein n=1 Tax=Monosporascus cannonballus TaxID=155416 RepID=A0ABY0H9L8_9PEZI|nr:hypothetical protein DL762_003753 [Monosporascus cannonballus]RYO96319.1 hypothetical protein DL763_003292 [Monosporascus cannonballus]RYP12264.1 hypothetical protein DL766_009980 [Monosporascus sp. MC13-8B]